MQKRHYEGEWSGAALRAPGGQGANIVPEAHDGSRFADTPLLGRCPYFQQVLATFKCPLQSVRLLRLHAGSNIAEHVDRALDFDEGEVRIHIPIATSEQVRFYLDGSRLVMAPGECWYTNVNLPHSVQNGGVTDRIHLVLDCLVDDWLRGIFATTPRPPRDHYAATLAAEPAPEPAALLQNLAGFRGAPGAGQGAPTFHIEQQVLVLQWPGEHAWQIRLRLPAESASSWTAQLESSPDPSARHLADYRALREHLLAAFPALQISDAVA